MHVIAFCTTPKAMTWSTMCIIHFTSIVVKVGGGLVFFLQDPGVWFTCNWSLKVMVWRPDSAKIVSRTTALAVPAVL